jgi:tryptophan 2,3-dioxygenase
MIPKRRLSYAEYINDQAIVEALRIPQPPPEGQSEESWPTWHPPGDGKVSKYSTEWKPGDRWPHGKNWSHHEVLFIRTHQAFEVWFAVVLHELTEVMQQARDGFEVVGSQVPWLELEGRTRDVGREFSPARFPELAAVGKAFKNEFIRSRVLLMPTPGRYSIKGIVSSFQIKTLEVWSSHVNRAAAALRTTIPFFDVLGTMTPRQFLEFRGRLASASGFGSTQFREIEMLLGLRELSLPRIRPKWGTPEPEPGGEPLPEGMLRPTKKTPQEEATVCFYAHHLAGDWPRLAARFREPSMRDLVYALLNANVFRWAKVAELDATVDRFAAQNVHETLARYDRKGPVDETRIDDHIDGLGEVLSHRETITAALLEMGPLDELQAALRSFLDACMNMESALLRWRDQHIRFVESMIGRRPGTGGTGVNYLRTTTDAGLATHLTHAFPCLWQARSIVQPT